MSTKKLTSIVAMILVVISANQDACGEGSNEKKTIWIYRDIPGDNEDDNRSATEAKFGHYGFMPAERVDQIFVDSKSRIDRNDRSKGTCIEYSFKFNRTTDWQGVYSLVDGDAWGTKPGIDVQELMGVEPDTKIVLRFKAKGSGKVTFKIGGVNTGKYRSSLPLPRQTASAPTRLTPEFQEYSIGPIAARQLTNLIDPFCVVTSGLDNRGVDQVMVYVDDIRLELYEPPKGTSALQPGWRERLSQTLFVSFTPSGFDPTLNPVKTPSVPDIKSDLKAIRGLLDEAGIKGRQGGIVTYGCRDGLELVPELVREVNLSVILGIFNPRDSVEVENAARLLGQEDLNDTIVACCVGNEAITFRRATFADIEKVASDLREVRRVPMTSTEIVQSYGDERLFSFDFSFVNAHAIFASVYDPKQAAQWAIDRMQDLVDTAPRGHLILIKEIGWPAGPTPRFDDAQQASYWRTVLSSPVARRVNVCIFDGLNNVPWKREPINLPDGTKANVGPHWPVLFSSADRTPKTFAVELLQLWKKTRSS